MLQKISEQGPMEKQPIILTTLGAYKILSSAKVDEKGCFPLASFSRPDSKASPTLKKILAKAVAFGNSGFFTCF